MEHLGCSRATAFRRIKDGFRIPREHESELVADPA
jgi:hypothetical protein